MESLRTVAERELNAAGSDSAQSFCFGECFSARGDLPPQAECYFACLELYEKGRQLLRS